MDPLEAPAFSPPRQVEDFVLRDVQLTDPATGRTKLFKMLGYYDTGIVLNAIKGRIRRSEVKAEEIKPSDIVRAVGL